MTIIKYLSDYLDGLNYPKNIKESLKQNWKTSVKKRIDDYDGKYFIESRCIATDYEINISWSDKYRSIYKVDNELWVSSAVPAWRKDWKKYIKNEQTRELVDDYFHLLTQYWHRCNVTPILVFLMWRYSVSAEYVGSHTMKYENFSNVGFQENFKNKELTEFVEQINCDHPMVHNACYHYIRMWNLLNNDFTEDAFVNMDCIASLVKMRCEEAHGKHSSLTLLGFNEKEIKMMTLLHTIRSEFAAHPSQSKWWDFFELFENESDEYTDFSINMILKISSSYSHSPIPRTYDGITNASGKFHDCFWFNKINKCLY
jgi:hypothetical protein